MTDSYWIHVPVYCNYKLYPPARAMRAIARVSNFTLLDCTKGNRTRGTLLAFICALIVQLMKL